MTFDSESMRNASWDQAVLFAMAAVNILSVLLFSGQTRKRMDGQGFGLAPGRIADKIARFRLDFSEIHFDSRDRSQSRSLALCRLGKRWPTA